MSVIRDTYSKKLITPLKWVPDNLIYEVQSGSESYGCSLDDNGSDIDIIGITMNPITDFFPHLNGHINGFSKPYQSFTTWQHHHLFDDVQEYDITVHSISNWFTLLTDKASPNMIEILFSPLHMVRCNTQIAQHIRSKRHIFLSKKLKHTFIGYAYSQLHKIEKKETEGKRKHLIEKYGWNVKYGMHLLRLFYQCEQLLSEHTLDLNRHSEVLKSVRNGEWSEQKLKEFISVKEPYIEQLYQKSTLPNEVDISLIQNLLFECIEMHYGSVSRYNVYNPNKSDIILSQIKNLLSTV